MRVFIEMPIRGLRYFFAEATAEIIDLGEKAGHWTFAVHRYYFEDGKGWRVSNVETGLALTGTERTRSAALNSARSTLRRKTSAQLNAALVKAGRLVDRPMNPLKGVCRS